MGRWVEICIGVGVVAPFEGIISSLHLVGQGHFKLSNFGENLTELN